MSRPVPPVVTAARAARSPAAGARLVLLGAPAGAGRRRGRAEAAGERPGGRDGGRAAAGAGRVGGPPERGLSSGTQHVVTWRGRRGRGRRRRRAPRPGAAGLQVQPRRGAGPRRAAGAQPSTPRLAARCWPRRTTSRVAGRGRCAGRDHVGRRGPPRTTARRRPLLGRRDSGLLLRREVYDAAGRPVRSSAFVDVEVSPAAACRALAAPAVAGPAGGRAGRAEGWHVAGRAARRLPAVRRAAAADHAGRAVLHLAYSDGLSTMSLFAQRGRPGRRPATDGFAPQHVGGRPVWVRTDGPERVVWSGGGQVWTLVSDARPTTCRARSPALPRDRADRDAGLRRPARPRAGPARLLARPLRLTARFTPQWRTRPDGDFTPTGHAGTRSGRAVPALAPRRSAT